MSYDSDFESVYMVEFKSGRIIHVSFYEVQDVKEYCADEHPTETIKTIYKEIYVGDEDDGQPDEQQEWESFDSDC
jgi:hypothetical protein